MLFHFTTVSKRMQYNQQATKIQFTVLPIQFIYSTHKSVLFCVLCTVCLYQILYNSR